MSATPRTDSESNRLKSGLFDGMYVPVNFARELEKELAEAKADAARAEAQLAFLKEKGLTVGMMKTTDKPEPYMVYVFEPGSELDNIPTVNKLIYTELERGRLREALEMLWSSAKVRALTRDAAPDIADDVTNALSTLQTGQSSAWLPIESREVHFDIEGQSRDCPDTWYLVGSCSMEDSANTQLAEWRQWSLDHPGKGSLAYRLVRVLKVREIQPPNTAFDREVGA